MERSFSGQDRSKRVKRSWEYRTSRRTFLVRSTGKGPEESTAAMLGSCELCEPHPTPMLTPPFLSPRASHRSTPITIRNIRRRTGAVSKRSWFLCVPSLTPSRHHDSSTVGSGGWRGSGFFFVLSLYTQHFSSWWSFGVFVPLLCICAEVHAHRRS